MTFNIFWHTTGCCFYKQHAMFSSTLCFLTPCHYMTLSPCCLDDKLLWWQLTSLAAISELCWLLTLDAAPTLSVDRSVASPGARVLRARARLHWATSLRAVTIFTTSRCSPGPRRGRYYRKKRSKQQLLYKENLFFLLISQLKEKYKRINILSNTENV